MVKSPRLEKDKKDIIKDGWNLFKLQKEINDTTIKNKRYLSRLKKENEATKDRVIRDIRNLLEHEEHYYKPVRVGNLWSNNYIGYESNADRNKTSVE